MTTGTGELAKAPAKNADGFLDDWRALRADDDIQFAPIRPSEPDPPPEPPDWLRDFLEWLGVLLSPVGDALGAFATIAERVERSLFALRTLSADDWHAARAAYADFALAAPQAELRAA